MIETRSMKKQRGVTLISVSLALVAIIVISVMAARGFQNLRFEQVAKVTFSRVENIHDAMQRAYMSAITSGVNPSDINTYPSDSAQLVSLGYIDSCPNAAEAAQECINQLKLPWVSASNIDEQITISTSLDPSDNYPTFTLSFSIAGIQPVKQRNLIRAKLAELPNYTENASGIVSFNFKRPASTVMYENLVSRDGSKTLTDTWDIGGQYIVNIKDIAFADLNDRTAVTGLLKMGSVSVSDSGGVDIQKISCPAGYTASIEPWAGTVGGLDESDMPYNTRGSHAWYVDNGTDWRLFYRALGENENGIPTYFYKGVVTYATWCDL